MRPPHGAFVRMSLSRWLRTPLLVLPFVLFLWPGTPVQASTVRESILANGMKVLLVEVPKAPVVTVQIWYRVGSRNEVMGRAGLSHMLEHMMFKGTERYPKGTFSRTIRKNGGNDKAFTSQDYTPHFEKLAADRGGLGLELGADPRRGVLLDEKEFQLWREGGKEKRGP